MPAEKLQEDKICVSVQRQKHEFSFFVHVPQVHVISAEISKKKRNTGDTLSQEAVLKLIKHTTPK